MAEQTGSRVPALRLTVLAGSCAWVACLAVVHVVRTDLDPRHVPVSSYLHGPHSGIARLGAVGACVALLALAALLRRGRATTLVPSLVLAAAIAMFVGTVVAPRPDEGAGSWGVASTEGAVHLASAGLAIILLLTVMILSVQVRGAPRWIAATSTLVTLVAGGAFVCFLADVRRADMERVTLAAMTAWALAAAVGPRGREVVRPTPRTDRAEPGAAHDDSPLDGSGHGAPDLSWSAALD